MKDVNIERFSRQLILSGWSLKAQSLLSSQSLLIEVQYQTAILYALAAGIFRITLIGVLPSTFVDHLYKFQPLVELNTLDHNHDDTFWDFLIIDRTTHSTITVKTNSNSRLYVLDHTSVVCSQSTILSRGNGLDFTTDSNWREFASTVALSDYLNFFGRLPRQVR